ncbi:hypothetical protein ERO13_D08G154000v2 [Gossypium hirsutum]|uniref:Uncharacterized protein At1g01500 n=1 Tax=Gossypium hirsutum TaxID=3635 RepID=A0A1U8IVH9_GOSHI|nr:uncharacterized protein At1g01500 [Gossypium hirsutum]KAG4134397.1 hypothetical protein ERO13_D08G154000v2 [Gossypium hirsutum]
MDLQQLDPLQISIPKASDPYSIMNNSSVWLEIRLFYVRIAPCVIDSAPDHLTLCYLRREIGFSLEVNGSRVPASDSASFTLRRDRLDRESSEVTYLSTDSVRVTGGFEFEVYENEKMMLCGSLERMEGEWSMDCYMAAAVKEPGNSAFFQWKKGVSAPSIEVYIAGCSAGVPVILTKTITVSPWRKNGSRLSSTLDAIPEDEEIGKGNNKGSNGLVRHRNLQVTESGLEDYEFDGKIGHGYYSEDMYAGEDGQLSWFNAGVRVGVGIGLGMCLGVGIGVGLLMRSYQATTRNFRRRFF